MLSVTWVKCQGGLWCALETVNLTTVQTGGVYIIWHVGNPARVVRVGQGDIAARLAAHRNDREILAYGKFGQLRVTWATVPAQHRDGVERYLADKWTPLVGDAFPLAQPIAVNSPFAA